MAVVQISGTVLLGGKIPFGDQYGFVSGQLTQAIEIVVRNPAVRTVHIIVSSYSVDERDHRSNRVRIVVAGQAVAEDGRLRIRLAQYAVDQFVVMMRQDAGPFTYDPYPTSSWTNPRLRIAIFEQLLKRGNPRCYDKVIGKAMPISAIVTTDKRDQLLLGVICSGLSEVVTEQRPVPPANLVVGEISNAIRIPSVRSDHLPRHDSHPLFDRRIEGVGPMK